MEDTKISLNMKTKYDNASKRSKLMSEFYCEMCHKSFSTKLNLQKCKKCTQKMIIKLLFIRCLISNTPVKYNYVMYTTLLIKIPKFSFLCLTYNLCIKAMYCMYYT